MYDKVIYKTDPRATEQSPGYLKLHLNLKGPFSTRRIQHIHLWIYVKQQSHSAHAFTAAEQIKQGHHSSSV